MTETKATIRHLPPQGEFVEMPVCPACGEVLSLEEAAVSALRVCPACHETIMVFTWMQGQFGPSDPYLPIRFWTCMGAEYATYQLRFERAWDAQKAWEAERIVDRLDFTPGSVRTIPNVRLWELEDWEGPQPEDVFVSAFLAAEVSEDDAWAYIVDQFR